MALDGPVDGPDRIINLNIKLCDVLCKIVLCFKYWFGLTFGRTCRLFLLMLRPLVGPADFFCSSDKFFRINIQRMALDGPVDGPDRILNINIKLCDVLCKIVQCCFIKFFYINNKSIALGGPVDGPAYVFVMLTNFFI